MTPACWSWPVPEDLATLDADADKRAALFKAMGIPLPQRSGREILHHWQDGRCGMCGRRVARLVEDHDHDTGMARGLLCVGCNLAEGHDVDDPVMAMWRERPAVAVLGVEPFRYQHLNIRGSA